MTVGPSALSALARGSSSTVRATRECMHWRTAMTTLGGGRRLSETSCPPRFSGATCACTIFEYLPFLTFAQRFAAYPRSSTDLMDLTLVLVRGKVMPTSTMHLRPARFNS